MSCCADLSPVNLCSFDVPRECIFLELIKLRREMHVADLWTWSLSEFYSCLGNLFPLMCGSQQMSILSAFDRAWRIKNLLGNNKSLNPLIMVTFGPIRLDLWKLFLHPWKRVKWANVRNEQRAYRVNSECRIYVFIIQTVGGRLVNHFNFWHFNELI